jgi:RNA polymerase sigma-70 factor, ECF subfamily
MTRDEVDEIFQRFGPMVFRRARSLLGSDAEGKDVMQEVFIKAMAESIRFDEPAQAASWLYRVTTNTCLNHIRDTRRQGELRRQHLREDETVEAAEDAKLAARQLLADAERSQSEAAVLVHIDGLSYDEASEVLGVSKRTISNLLLRFKTFAIERFGEGV